MTPLMLGGFFSYGIYGIVLMALALMHFVRKRPDTYWLYIILFLGPLGALVYLAVEALPELRDPGTFKIFPRRRRIKELELTVLENPSAGNYEELGQLYLDDGKWQRARAAFDRSISSRTDSADPFYRRAIAEVELGDFTAAVPDLERAVAADPKYDFHRAAGLLAYAYARTGQPAKAEAMFGDVIRLSTLTESQYHYAEFLAEQGRKDEAREWTERILAKRATMPGFQKRRDRPWFRRTKALLGKLK
ncbi:MAG TPA: tetratricopeptide repeat protein [Clostridia bacterium]|nr:tetratricopeptide repeat protein [Clostridia bacterium]